MAVQNEINVGLSLNDHGFGAKIAEASTRVKSLNSDLLDFGKKVSGAEGRFETLGSKVTSTSTRFNALGKNMSAFAESLKDATKSITKITDDLQLYSRTTETAEQRTSRLAAESQNLRNAQFAAAEATRSQSAALEAQARIMRNVGEQAAGLARNLFANRGPQTTDQAGNKELSMRQRLYQQLIAEERKYQREIQAEKAKQLALAMELEKVEQRVITPANNARVVQLQREIELSQERLNKLQQGASVIGQEAEKQQGLIRSINGKNAEMQRSLALQTELNGAVDREAAARTRAHEATRANLGMMREQMQVLRGMAELWGAFKIERGFAASARMADTSERVDARINQLNFTGEERAGFSDVAGKVRAVAPFSNTEARKMTLAGTTGLAHFDKPVLDALMPEIAKMVNVLAYTNPEQAHNAENAVRNIMGLVEASGATGDKDKAMAILDNVYRGLVATGGKVAFEDTETFARRYGMGNMPMMRPDAWLDAIAFMNQMKVMGGSGGSGGGGVSTAGVMARMFQSAADGKKPTNKTIEDLLSMGIIDKEKFVAANGGIEMKTFKNSVGVSWTNNEESHGNIFKYSHDIGQTMIKEILANDKLKAKYFGDKDTEDVNNRQQALKGLLNATGYSTNVVEFITALSDPRVWERVQNERKMAEKTSSASVSNEQIKGNYGQATKEFGAALNDLGTTIGKTVLPMITELVKGLNSFLQAANEFAKNNPIATQITAAAVAFGGLVMAVNGARRVFGIIGSLSSILISMRGAAAGVAPAAATSIVSLLGLGSIAARVSGMFSGLVASISGIATTGLAAVGLFARGLLRFIPFVGWFLAAWDLTGVLLNLKIGGKNISEWLGQWMNDLTEWWTDAWLNIKLGVLESLQFEGYLGASFDWIAEKIEGLSKWFNEKLDEMGDDIIRTFDSFGNAMIDSKNALIEWSDNGIGYAISKAAELYENLTNVSNWRPTNILENTAGRVRSLTDTFNPLSGVTGYIEGLRRQKEDRNSINLDRAIEEAERLQPSGYGRDTSGPADITWKENKADKPKAPRAAVGGAGKKSNEFIQRDPLIAMMESYEWNARVKASKYERMTGNMSADEMATQQALDEIVGRAKAGDFTKKGKENPFAALIAEYNSVKVNRDANGAITEDSSKAISEAYKKLSEGILKNPNAKTAFDNLRGELLLDEKLKQGKSNAERVASALASSQNVLQFDANGQPTADLGKYTKHTATALKAFDAAEAKNSNNEKAKLWANDANTARSFVGMVATAEQDLSQFISTYAPKDAQTIESKKWVGMGEREKQMAVFNLNEQKFQDELVKMESQLKNFYEDAKASALKFKEDELLAAGDNNEKRLKIEADTEAKLLELKIRNSNDLAALDTFRAKHKEAADFELVRLSKTRLEVMAEDWKKTTEAMENASAGWADGFIDELHKLITTGKADFKGFVASILMEMAKIQMKSAMAESTNSLFSWITKLGSFAISSMTGTPASTGTDYSLSSGTNLDSMGGGQGMKMGFARGGIMTGFGPVPLQAYARGGVATSPQMALFGESSMPEAYVPLPDGRTIPVTLQGGGGAGGNTVTIQINVDKSGAATETKSGNDDQGTAQKMADRIRVVVQEELVTQKRPGGLLYR